MMHEDNQSRRIDVLAVPHLRRDLESRALEAAFGLQSCRTTLSSSVLTFRSPL